MMVCMSQVLAGKRVLIVEDELLVALLIEDVLVDLGCSTAGSVRQRGDGVGCSPNRAV